MQPGDDRTAPAALEALVKVVAAVKRDLKGLPKQLAQSTLAASALALAAELDKVKISATARASCARALRETMEELRSLAPPAEESDAVDEIKRRAK